ncbi:asparagine synthase (glutamine-hydrolyzing) [Variovorax robiniae]|uniref:asparagine synthase (glutamine-hydrolyzing) n=1 Tax=Variovorax robiniae TaxID=1836199 RepID=A0ABU8XH23_9BURK
MCGIFGYWDRAGSALDDAALAAMAGMLRHRGPDDEGICHTPQRGVALGNRRLSIIDVGGGHQPFVSDDGQVTVVQNGEIFNYIELAQQLRREGIRLRTHSDTEVILRLYEREGIACLTRLNGMFAIAVDDAREDALYLARDRVGEKPLYVAEDGERMLFASEIKAFWPAARAGLSRDALDLEAIHHYLTFNYVPPPWTVYRNVRHVMPGTWKRFSRSGVKTERWWRLADQRERPMEEGAWREEFLALLDDATRIRLRADVPWGAFLSGGVDSSTIVGLMSRHVRDPVKTFCIGFEDSRFDESRHAQEAAQRFACDHTNEVAELNMLDRWPQVLWHLDQPHGDASFMPTLRISELAAKHVKVVLTGDGGDELFAGYDKYAGFFAQSEMQIMGDSDFRRAYFDSISLFSPGAKQALYRPEIRKTLNGSESYADVAEPWFEEGAHFGRVNQALHLDMQLLLSGNNLVKPDRMGMAMSIEARAPFLDHRLVEFAFRAPDNTKLIPTETKHWYKNAVESLIGTSLARRRKQMFTVPVGEWFRSHRYRWLCDVIRNSALLGTLFDVAVMDSMIERHRNGTANHTRELRALAAIAQWDTRSRLGHPRGAIAHDDA